MYYTENFADFYSPEDLSVAAFLYAYHSKGMNCDNIFFGKTSAECGHFYFTTFRA